MATIIICKNQKEIDDCSTVKITVFTNEQNIGQNIVLDEKDLAATHFLAIENNEPCGAARLIEENKNTARLQRLAVLPQYRGKGIAKQIMQAVEIEAKKQKYKKIVLDAQTHATGLYTKLNYKKAGKEFMEVGIPHILMEKIL